MSRLKRLIQEIHRRSLWQVLGIYLGGAWVALQGIEALVSVLGLPDWVPGVALVLLIVGLPIVLSTAFVQEGVGAGETPAEAQGTATPADAGGLHLVLTWRNVILGGVLVIALAGIAAGGWVLLGGEISRSPETIRSIAVLPLENLTGDPKQEYFADGMTEAVISEFARLGALSVISRTSVMQYKDVRKPLPEIAQELGVQAIVEGSVFRAGDRVRITLQLIDARNDLHLWAQTYERDLRDVLALQGDVARAVAEQIHLKLTPEEREALTAHRTVDPRAYDAYLRGLQLRDAMGLSGLWASRAIEEFTQAVELDPTFAEAYAALAQARYWLGIFAYNLSYRGEFTVAEQAAERALELDHRLGKAHNALGAVRLWRDWDFAGAGRAWKRGMQLSPSDPDAVDAYVFFLLVVGRTEEGLAVTERLLRLAPLDPFYRGQLARFFYMGRQYGRALEETERARELDPGWVDADLSGLYLLLGQIEAAHRERLAYYEKCGAPCSQMQEAVERGWAEGGPEEATRALLDVLTSIEGFSPWYIAANFVVIGEKDEAFAWLERGYRDHDPLMVMTKSAPILDPLRSDPRFDDLLRRIGFPEE